MPTVMSDIYTAGTAVEFTANNQVWVIPAGLIAMSTNDTGAESAFVNSTLRNLGYLLSSSNAGVAFSGDGARVVNFANAVIAGANGVRFTGGAGIDLVNRGVISGLSGFGIEVGITTSDADIRNFGEVRGVTAGIYVSSGAGAGPNILNAGNVHGETQGLAIAPGMSMLTTIVNRAGAVIRGDVVGIDVFSGHFTLTNRGRIVGDIDTSGLAGNLDDTIRNHKVIVGDVRLGSGEDLYEGRLGRATLVWGESGDDKLFGGARRDVFDGGNGIDRLDGRGGNDLIEGGALGDIIFGGPGADDLHMYLASNPALTDAAVDTIRYRSLTESGLAPATRDEIFGFNKAPMANHDRIDLSAIDANGNAPGNGKFKIVAAFTNARGEIKLVTQGANTLVQVDGDNDTFIDMMFLIRNVTGMSGADFVL